MVLLIDACHVVLLNVTNATAVHSTGAVFARASSVTLPMLQQLLLLLLPLTLHLLAQLMPYCNHHSMRLSWPRALVVERPHCTSTVLLVLLLMPRTATLPHSMLVLQLHC